MRSGGQRIRSQFRRIRCAGATWLAQAGVDTEQAATSLGMTAEEFEHLRPCKSELPAASGQCILTGPPKQSVRLY